MLIFTVYKLFQFTVVLMMTVYHLSYDVMCWKWLDSWCSRGIELYDFLNDLYYVYLAPY